MGSTLKGNLVCCEDYVTIEINYMLLLVKHDCSDTDIICFFIVKIN